MAVDHHHNNVCTCQAVRHGVHLSTTSGVLRSSRCNQIATSASSRWRVHRVWEHHTFCGGAAGTARAEPLHDRSRWKNRYVSDTLDTSWFDGCLQVSAQNAVAAVHCALDMVPALCFSQDQRGVPLARTFQCERALFMSSGYCVCDS